jgi:uncharacterized membrane protein
MLIRGADSLACPPFCNSADKGYTLNLVVYLMGLKIIHILAVAVYFGSTFFMDLLLLPALNRIPPAQAAIVSQQVGETFAVLAWVSLGIIIVSGVLRLYVTGTLTPELFLHPYGWWIGALMFLALLLAINGLIMTIWIRPRMKVVLSTRATEADLKVKQTEAMAAVTTLNRLVRLNLIIAGLALIIGASLSFGGLF